MTNSSFIHYQNLILQVWLGRIWGCLPLPELDQDQENGDVGWEGMRLGLEEVAFIYLYTLSSYYVQET